MRFEEALKAMREGKKVNPNCYKDSKYIYYLDRNGKQIILILYGNEVATTFNYQEIMSEDWEIIDE